MCEKSTTILYYTPFSKKVRVLYNRKDDRKIVCMKGSCDLPDTELDTDGNIILNGYHDYPINGNVKITGEFYWRTPIYKYDYVRYEGIYNPLSARVNYKRIGTVSLNELGKYLESLDELDSYGDGDIVAYGDHYNVYKKEKHIAGWRDGKPFEYIDEPIEIYREWVAKDDYLFRGFYNIRRMVIKPIGTLKQLFSNSIIEIDNLSFVVNDMCYDFNNNLVLDLDDPNIIDLMGPMGFIVQDNPTVRFQRYGLSNGCYNFYKVTVEDHKPQGIEVG